MVETDCDADVWFVSVASLKRHVNPLRRSPWQGSAGYGKSLRAAVTRCLNANDLSEQPWDSGDRPAQKHGSDDGYHAKRIAYLVRNPDATPIDIDVGIPSIGFVPSHLIMDGNHRAAAAIYRSDAWIAIAPSGSIALLRRMFDRRPSKISQAAARAGSMAKRTSDADVRE